MLSDRATQIFVVDDEPVIASTLAAILQMNGFSTRFFTSPLEALAAARSKAPDLLVSDVTMPGISGIDLAMKMRAQYPKVQDPALFEAPSHPGFNRRRPRSGLRISFAVETHAAG